MFVLLYAPVIVIPVNKLPLPTKKLAVTKLPKLAFPAVRFPDTFAFAKVTFDDVSSVNPGNFVNDIVYLAYNYLVMSALVGGVNVVV